MGTSRYQKKQPYVLVRQSGILTECKTHRQTDPEAASSPTWLAVRLPTEQPVGVLPTPQALARRQGATGSSGRPVRAVLWAAHVCPRSSVGSISRSINESEIGRSGSASWERMQRSGQEWTGMQRIGEK